MASGNKLPHALSGGRRALCSTIILGSACTPLMVGSSPITGEVHDTLPGQASVATLKVCPRGCAYAQLAPALAAAKSGDTILIDPGTYTGGVKIEISVKLVGAGAGQTIISGGGPVLTIGTFGALTEPTVSIDGVTITGGVTRSSSESVPEVGQEGVLATGGGIEIPPNSNFSGGATVTIKNSVITGNVVAPTDTVPSGPPCPSGPCPFALAAGGGIYSWGTLTLENSTVNNNRIGSASGLSTLASEVLGGAIASFGPLTIRGSFIYDNHASATGPNGRFAEGGAIIMFGRTFTLINSLVARNSAELAASLPNSVDTSANSGGMHLTSTVSAATIRNTTIAGNSVTMTNTVGDAMVFSGGIHVDLEVDFRMSNCVVADNTVSSATLAGSSGNAAGYSGAGEFQGKISNTRFSGNSVTVTSAAGDATAIAGGFFAFGSIAHSVISDNHVHASSPGGTVFAAGGGIVVSDTTLALRNSKVMWNTVDASGVSGSASGGGIFDAPIANGAPGGPLTLLNSDVTANTVSGSAGITLQGGGMYTQDQPLTLNHSEIVGNSPDQCVGC
jgi:hypothetical protein